MKQVQRIEQVEGDLRIYPGEAWIVFVHEKNWWAERLVGFVKCTETEHQGMNYSVETTTVWCPAYTEYGFVTAVRTKQKCEIVYGRKPTEEDGIAVRQGTIIDAMNGEFK